MKKVFTILGLCLLISFSNASANTIINGDLKIGDGGELVFSDGSVQSKAQVQGPQGIQGPVGPPNILTIGTVLPGVNAAASISGTAPNQVLNLTIPQGPACQISLTSMCAAIYEGGEQLPAFCSSYGATILTSISVTPVNPTISIPSGANLQFTATGTYANGSTQNLTATAIWSSGTNSVATINSAGYATGVAVGTSVITAAAGAKSGNTTLTVQPLPTIPTKAIITVSTTGALPAGKLIGAVDATIQSPLGVAPQLNAGSTQISSNALTLTTLTNGGIIVGGFNANTRKARLPLISSNAFGTGQVFVLAYDIPDNVATPTTSDFVLTYQTVGNGDGPIAGMGLTINVVFQ